MIIGICGKSGSGKSTLAALIEKSRNNVIHIDIDKIGHKVLLIPEVKDELIKAFGNVITKVDSIDRKKLGEIVFNSRNEMSKLADITWKYMQIEIDKIIKSNKDKIIILDWILLPSTKYFNMCDIKILLDIPYKIRKQRAMKRDNISEELFDLREGSSTNYNENDFDYVFKSNDEDIIRRMVKSI